MDVKQLAELVHSLREAGRVARSERKPAPKADTCRKHVVPKVLAAEL